MRFVRCSTRSAFGVLVVILVAGADAPRISQRLNRENLLLYLDAEGRTQPVRTIADWQKRRAIVLEAMQQVMGSLPGPEKRCPLDIQIEEEIDVGTFLRRRLTYASEPGSRVPAYLLLPKQAVVGDDRKLAAILCLHPTNLEFGPQSIVGLQGRPQMQYALELAQRGYVVLAPCYPRMGHYEPDLDKLAYQSTTMKAIWDNIRGIDLLQSLSCVKSGGVGAIGHSLGGHNTVYTAVFDDRVIVAVSSCGLDSYLDYKHGDISGWTSKWYMPRLLAYKDRLPEIPFDFHEMIGALAPRHCFINAPMRDDNFQWRSVDRVVRASSTVYELHRVADRLTVVHPDCGHDFPDEVRERAYRLFDQVLRDGNSSR